MCKVYNICGHPCVTLALWYTLPLCFDGGQLCYAQQYLLTSFRNQNKQWVEGDDVVSLSLASICEFWHIICQENISRLALGSK